MLTEGLTYTSQMIVTEKDTAAAMGSGTLPVLATPRKVALMENAAMLAVAPELAEGETTVGSYIETSHLAPSPIGAHVEATAILVNIEGRKLSFEIETRDGDKVIGKGRHVRHIVDSERFMSKLG